MAKKAFIILNSLSGWDDKQNAQRTVRRVFESHGWSCHLHRVTAPCDLRAITAEAIGNGYDMVAAGGGDGTLRAVAHALAGAKVPLAVLPGGTLNHFARDLEIPIDLETAAEIGAGLGRPATVDVGEVNGFRFLNNCVIGLYPDYFHQRKLRERLGWRKATAIADAIGSVLQRYPSFAVRLETEDRTLVRRTPWMMIANNEHAMEGVKPWERGRLTEGRLWVYILRGRSRRALLRVLCKVLAGGALAHGELEVVRASELWVESRRTAVNISVDGEVMRLPPPLYFRSLARKLRVIVPPGSKCLRETGEFIGGVKFAS